MERYDRTPDGATTGGSANTPTFGDDPARMRTAPDHQIAEETGPAHAASGAGAPSTGGGTGAPAGTRTSTETPRAEELAGRAEEKVNQGMRQAADRMETFASRLDQVADERLAGGSGAKARAGSAAHGLADTMESVAGYLRDNDVQALRGDLERQMRERPLQTLMVAVAAGWLVGKIVR